MDILSTLAGNIALGLSTALSPTTLLYCFIGVFIGTLVGVIPGLGALAAMSLLFPFTFYLDVTTGLVMLAGIYYGVTYGGSTASILLNLPGTPQAAVTCLDGYPMARQGRAGVALLMTTVASFFGASVGIILMMLFAPVIVDVALNFGAADFFSMMVLGLVAASAIASGPVVKALAMVVLGVAFGVVGTDVYTGVPRFTFGLLELAEGMSLVALAMGLFGVPEVIASIRAHRGGGGIDRRSITFRSMVPTREDVRRSWMPMLRGTGIGAFFGTLPGTGGTIASFMSYAVERRVARDPSRFGKGAIEGIAGPEAATNASDQTAFIPTMTLGIPGAAPMAIILGVLMIHGVAPGPRLMLEQPSLFWGLIMSFWIGNLLLLVLNIPLIGLWVRILMIPYRVLYPAILMFICIGVFSIRNSVVDVWMVIFFGAIGHAMRQLELPAAPLLLGFVLGPMMEEHFRRAMILSQGDLGTFVSRPISAGFLAAALLLLLWGLWSGWRRRAARGLDGALGRSGSRGG